MKFQIWFSEAQQIGTFTEELSEDERKAFEEELGFALQEEFSSDSKEDATRHFISWCDDQSGIPNRVGRVDLVGALQRAIEPDEGPHDR